MIMNFGAELIDHVSICSFGPLLSSFNAHFWPRFEIRLWTKIASSKQIQEVKLNSQTKIGTKNLIPIYCNVLFTQFWPDTLLNYGGSKLSQCVVILISVKCNAKKQKRKRLAAQIHFCNTLLQLSNSKCHSFQLISNKLNCESSIVHPSIPMKYQLEFKFKLILVPRLVFKWCWTSSILEGWKITLSG